MNCNPRRLKATRERTTFSKRVPPPAASNQTTVAHKWQLPSQHCLICNMLSSSLISAPVAASRTLLFPPRRQQTYRQALRKHRTVSTSLFGGLFGGGQVGAGNARPTCGGGCFLVWNTDLCEEWSPSSLSDCHRCDRRGQAGLAVAVAASRPAGCTAQAGAEMGSGGSKHGEGWAPSPAGAAKQQRVSRSGHDITLLSAEEREREAAKLTDFQR